MQTIGLLGGMSWESTASYYKIINQQVKLELGGLHSAKICLTSVDFAEIEQLQHQGDWQKTAEILTSAAMSVQNAGADFLLICTNTMHKVAPEIAKELTIPIIHIADATAEQLVSDGVSKVGLLGTRFTMEQDFYKTRLSDKYGISVLVPEQEQQQIIHQVIYNELCQGVIKSESKKQYLAIINQLFKQGAQAIILGCTEIAMLIKQEDTLIPLYDTTTLHAHYAVSLALK